MTIAMASCVYSHGICLTHCLHDGAEDASGCLHADLVRDARVIVGTTSDHEIQFASPDDMVPMPESVR